MLLPSIFSNNFLDEFFDNSFSFRDYGNSERSAVMNADIREFEDHYQMELELPGIQKENIRAELKEGYLVVSARQEAHQEEKDSSGRYLRRERYCGTYQRSFYVGEGVRQEEIKAGFENGVLTLTVPKQEARPAVEKKRYISIEG